MDLDDYLLSHILQFVGPGCYRYVGGVNRRIRQAYLTAHGQDQSKIKYTTYRNAVASVGCTAIWIQGQGIAAKFKACENAAKGGYLKVLQWARANGLYWDESTCAYAAKGGHLEVLQWAKANGCPWDYRTCACAAKGGHLEVLQWARANGCDWDSNTCAYAAEEGHLEVLQWARANGCDV